jgi:hypothetical protein
MVTKLTRLTHKMAIQLHLMAESCIICNSRYRQLVRKLVDTRSYWYHEQFRVTSPGAGGSMELPR